MYKIIKIENGVVYVGKSSDSQFIEMPQSNFGFEPMVGDYVEFYKNGEDYIVSKADPIVAFTNVTSAKGISQKSKVVAGVLALILGAFGVYHFYIGDTGKGILRLVISAIGFIPIFLPVIFIVNVVWNLIIAISVLTSKPGTKYHQDAQGLELQD